MTQIDARNLEIYRDPLFSTECLIEGRPINRNSLPVQGRSGRQTETVDDLDNRLGWIDCTENAHASTAFAFQNVYFEHALH